MSVSMASTNDDTHQALHQFVGNAAQLQSPSIGLSTKVGCETTFPDSAIKLAIGSRPFTS